MEGCYGMITWSWMLVALLLGIVIGFYASGGFYSIAKWFKKRDKKNEN